jgi:hypothetical protein
VTHEEWHAMVEALWAACIANDVPPTDALAAFFRKAIEDDGRYHAATTTVPQRLPLRPSHAAPSERRFT